MTALVLIAKEPLPGRAKTRLHPPLSLDQAAELAAAAIDDTIGALAEVPATRRILLFDGERTPPSARDYETIPQADGELDVRLAAMFDSLAEPAVLIGMDTPQVSPTHLAAPFASWPENVDAWFGPAADGGFWALGMREPDGDLIRGVPMSRSDTGEHQLRRLTDAGLRVGVLATLTDVDTIADAREVARQAPATRFAALLSSFLGSDSPGA
ncbi:DUF2064 domain-containing protein [Homoserinibacter sp. GY 40078]|uniref:TIGR04282 family arsenosugar biosynthesis glycosyltransferase n=1 Tax=Homoserinibacter sp. GY 40078 TaxID=2603275 RepID=UPI0011CAD6FA|nr:DUF2064 domain-containing protein [Homoserinibacter sp. GY 40078]TXK17652.1 DUF2064 domain-containing protein [Homoserinibacter sp. GY 40078]